MKDKFIEFLKENCIEKLYLWIECACIWPFPFWIDINVLWLEELQKYEG